MQEVMPGGGYGAQLDDGEEGEWAHDYSGPPYYRDEETGIEMGGPEESDLGEQSLHSGSDSGFGVEVVANEAAAAAVAAAAAAQQLLQSVATVGETSQRGISSSSSRSAGALQAAPVGTYSIHVTAGGDIGRRCQSEERRLSQHASDTNNYAAGGFNPWHSLERDDSSGVPNLGERFARDTDDVLLQADEERGRRLTGEEISAVAAASVVDVDVTRASVRGASDTDCASLTGTLAGSSIPVAGCHHLDETHAGIASNDGCNPGEEMMTGCTTGIANPRQDEME